MATITKRRLVYRCAGSAAEECAFLKAQLIDIGADLLSIRPSRAGPHGKVTADRFSLCFSQTQMAWGFGIQPVTFEGTFHSTDGCLSIEVAEIHNPTAAKIHRVGAIANLTFAAIGPPLLLTLFLRLVGKPIVVSTMNDIMALLGGIIGPMVAAATVSTIGLAAAGVLFAYGKLEFSEPILRFNALVSPRWELVSEEVVG